MTAGDDRLTLALCGDVMTGRGVDQALPHPGDPRLWEAYVPDARGYLALAEAASGAVPRPVDPGWLWGDALPLLAGAQPDLRVINVETSITHCDDVAPGKLVHYRMAPENIEAITVARPDVCVLANNHVLDFGPQGLADTLGALSGAGIATVGAGMDAEQAARPAVVPVSGGSRVLVFAYGATSSGIPRAWAATPQRAGVALLPDLSHQTADEVAGRVRDLKQPGDVVIVSIHWGTNWGYEVSAGQVEFAHRLIDGGVDVVHGHSSHHPRPVEVYRDRLILYGCGDFIDDYEGVDGYAEYRDDLRLLYFASVAASTGALISLGLVPLRVRRLRLGRAPAPDVRWLQETLDAISRDYGSRFDVDEQGTLVLRT